MQSIGERLEEARKRKGLSIREASEATKIRSDYLHKFESNQFDINLPEIYVRGFLRTYANFLKASADKIINDYNGLGLGEQKGSRSIAREVYGRMDLSIGSKMDKTQKENPSAATPDEPVATNSDATPKNPATFVPPANARGTPIDSNLILKIGALVVAFALVVVFSVWLFSGHGGKPTESTAAAAASTEPVWVKPLSGEKVLSLKATSPVAVTVTIKGEQTTLYQGTIPRGERRDIPRRGALYVTANPYQNLIFEINGTPYNMPGPAADIRAP